MSDENAFSEKPLQPRPPTASARPVDVSPGLPLQAALAVDWLNQVIDVFDRIKQDAVLREYFERAATARDHQKKLRKIKSWLLTVSEPPDTRLVDLS